MNITRMHVFSKLVCLGLLIAAQLSSEANADYMLSRGRRIILDRGLQIHGETVPPFTPGGQGFTNIPLWNSANFTTLNFWCNPHPDVLAQMPAGTLWGRGWMEGMPENEKLLRTDEMPYADGFVSMQIYDEADITAPGILDEIKSAFAQFKANYANALVYTNFYPNQHPKNLSELLGFMQYTQPDMVMFDWYSDFSFPSVHRDYYYAAMQRYRTAGLAGYTLDGGVNSGPIPYAQYLNLSRGYGGTYSSPLPSESYVRLQQNASWAFGYSFLEAYVYNGTDTWEHAVMFDGPGDTQPNVVFDYVKEANRQSRNLGPALTRLVSTDILMIPGTGLGMPEGIARWNTSGGWNNRGIADTGGYADHIKSIRPTNGQGGPTSASYADVLIGYFNPLLAENPNCTLVDGLRFMIVNGSAGAPFNPGEPGDSAANSAQWYRMTFDFAGSDFNSLVRLSRDTGKVELVPLTRADGSTYYLDLNLPGGTGDLFGFWNSADPLPTVPEPACFSMTITNLFVLLAYAWKKGFIMADSNGQILN